MTIIFYSKEDLHSANSHVNLIGSELGVNKYMVSDINSVEFEWCYESQKIVTGWGLRIPMHMVKCIADENTTTGENSINRAMKTW